MAMTEEEARRLAEAFGELSSVIRTTTEEEKRLAAEEREAAKAAEKFKAKMDAASNVVGAVTDAFVTYNKEIYKGTSAAKADAAAMEKLATAAEYAGAALALLVPGGPIIKGVVAGLGLLGGQLLRLNAEVKIQTGEIYKAFQDLSKVGATGAAGMQGVFDSLMKVGLGTEKFGEYIKFISDNAQDLALIGGTVKRGSDMYTQAMGDLTDQQRIQMEILVGDRQAQSEAVMGFIKQQRLLTAGTKQQMDTSSAAVMRYIKETDELTRITGLNRAEQEKQNEQAMRNEVFLATVNEIRMTRGDAAADQLLNFNKALAATPKAQKAFQDGISGFIGNSEEASGQFLQTGGVVQEIGQRFREGMVTSVDQTAEELRKFSGAIGKNVDEMSHLAKVNNYGATYSADYFEAVRLQQMSQTIDAKKVAEAQADQTGALQAGTKMATAENDARQAQLNLQKTMNLGMESAIDGIAKRAAADKKVTEQALRAATALGKLAGEDEKAIDAQDDMNRAQMTATEKIESYSAGAVESVGKLIGKGLSMINTEAGQYVQDAAEKARKSRMTAETGYLQSQGRFKAAPAPAAEPASRATTPAPAAGAPAAPTGKAPSGAGAAPATPAAPGSKGTGSVPATPAAPSAPDSKGASTADQDKGKLVGRTQGLNEKLVFALENVAAEFGSPIKINSGVRTFEQQKQMYEEWLQGGGKDGLATVNTPSFGKVTKPARPGDSNHQDGNAVDVDVAVANQLDSMGLLAKNGLARPIAGDPVHIQLQKMETGGFLEAGKLAIAGENGKPEIIQGPATVSSNNDIMGAFANMTALLQRSVELQESMARHSSNTQDNTSMLLQYAQN